MCLAPDPMYILSDKDFDKVRKIRNLTPGDFVYNPESSSIIKDETEIVVMGESHETKRVREWVEGQ